MSNCLCTKGPSSEEYHSFSQACRIPLLKQYMWHWRLVDSFCPFHQQVICTCPQNHFYSKPEQENSESHNLSVQATEAFYQEDLGLPLHDLIHRATSSIQR
uniref:Uncharacterized protein n=1 Tax=Opuntia streptacantha TaxID=393608 RepID=A0A7C9A7S7_OPUST